MVQPAPTPMTKPPSLLSKLPLLEDDSGGKRAKMHSGSDTPGFRNR